MHSLFRVLLKPWWYRPLVYTLIALLLGTGGWVSQSVQAQSAEQVFAAKQNQERLVAYVAASTEYRRLTHAIADATTLGMDVTAATAELKTILALLTNGQYRDAQNTASAYAGALEQQVAERLAANQVSAAEAKKYGILALKITNGGGAAISLRTSDGEATSSVATEAGEVTLTAPIGTFTLVVTKSGYQTLTVENVTIVSQETTSLSQTLTATAPSSPKPTKSPTPTPTPTPPAGGSSTAHSSYERTTLSTSRGSFTADIATFELGAGKIQVIADTAADGDCATDCPVMAVKSYASRYSGAVAAVNGTYFCPSDYSWCHPDQVNNFFWKVLNPRVNAMINKNNGLGENDGFLTFKEDGTAKYLDTWTSWTSSGAWTGINHKPTLVKGGQNVLDEGTLDSKQLTAKTPRNAIILTGQTLKVLIIQSATVPDLAAACIALGATIAMNMDGGGSSALWYNGAYKRGPGRSVPNALVFIEQ